MAVAYRPRVFRPPPALFRLVPRRFRQRASALNSPMAAATLARWASGQL
jgi:hypothetical protein